MIGSKLRKGVDKMTTPLLDKKAAQHLKQVLQYVDALMAAIQHEESGGFGDRLDG